ncbi:MAG: hypothetical protein OEX12_09805 [Gammaproteobacteria bacterium]|nr:hypothetical protein [Gammaproteobacteria bacterium]
MRYREGMLVDGKPAEVNETMLVATAGFGLLTGLLMLFAGIRARLLWMIVWGFGLVIASLVYITYSVISE